MTCNAQIALNEEEMMPILRVVPVTQGPLLVLIPSIFAIGPDVVEYAESFSKDGALVYVLDSFCRESPGPLPIPAGAPQAIKRMQDADPETVLQDLLGAIEAGQAEELFNGSVILLGVCFGGQFAVKAAQKIRARGLATWHGGELLSVLEPGKLEETEIEMDFGGEDPLIPLSDIQKIQSALRAHNNLHIRVHENSEHGFTHRGTIKHNAEAACHAKDGVSRLIREFRAPA